MEMEYIRTLCFMLFLNPNFFLFYLKGLKCSFLESLHITEDLLLSCPDLSSKPQDNSYVSSLLPGQDNIRQLENGPSLM